MGLELLERRAAARQKAEEREQERALLGSDDDDDDGIDDDGDDRIGGTDGGGGTGGQEEGTLAALGEAAWFDLLPASIPLPTTTFTLPELRAAALSPAALDFCRAFGRGVRASAEGPLRRRLEDRCGARAGDPSPALVWATSAVQSRTFVLELPSSGGGGGGGGERTATTRVRRVLPPGIDFANHDAAAPTAEARVRHSPAAVQGLGAVEEVVAPRFRDGNGAGESVIELVAGAEGIRSVFFFFFSSIFLFFFSLLFFFQTSELSLTLFFPLFLFFFVFAGPARKSRYPTATTRSTPCSPFTASSRERREKEKERRRRPEAAASPAAAAATEELHLLPPLLPPPLLARGRLL